MLSPAEFDAQGPAFAGSAFSFYWNGSVVCVPQAVRWAAELVQMQTTNEAIAQGVSAQRLTFGYDHQSRRTRKVVEGWSSITETWISTSDVWFLYDGWNLIAELTMNPSTTTLEVTRSYAWGLDLSGSEQGAGGVGGLLLVKTGTTLVAPSYDGNGNVTAYLNAQTGAVLAVYDYDAFGRVVVKDDSGLPGGEGGVPYQFSTKYVDRETGLSYYGYRYYSAELGRWLNRDPIEEEGGVNLYGMVGNGPVNRVDLYGQIPIETVWDIGNIIYDIAVGDYVSLTADAAALVTPYVPAGSTKLLKGADAVSKVSHATPSSIIRIDNLTQGFSKLKITYGYVGKRKYWRHFKERYSHGWVEATRGGDAKFNPGAQDYHVVGFISDAFKEAFGKNLRKPSELNGYIFTTKFHVGASNGCMTNQIKLQVNHLGEVHAFPWKR